MDSAVVPFHSRARFPHHRTFIRCLQSCNASILSSYFDVAGVCMVRPHHPSSAVSLSMAIGHQQGDACRP